MFVFITVLQAIIGTLLVAVILMQKSEGGGLGVGGSPAGLMSARGAADFLTRATAVLAVLFVTLSIVLAVLAAGMSSGQKVDTTLNRAVPTQAPVQSVPQPNPGAPMANPAAPGATPGNPAAPAAK